MNKNAQNILSHIPKYPKWGSVINVAYSSGYLTEPYEGKHLKKEMKVFSRDLAIVTFCENKVIQEAEFVTQQATLALFKDMNIKYDGETLSYLSYVATKKE